MRRLTFLFAILCCFLGALAPWRELPAQSTSLTLAKCAIHQQLELKDNVPILLGLGDDFEILWSEYDASNPAAVIAIGDTSQQLHVTDKGAVATDWARSAGTHPELAIHSNTTPITDYLAIGNHDGTDAYLDVVGGTGLNFNVAGTTIAEVTALGLGMKVDDDGYFVGASDDAAFVWQDGDASNHAAVIALGNTSQQLHITDVGAIATDWNRSAGTHPEVSIHSNTTPATDYLAIGNHDGTDAYINLVGGTTLNFQIDGTGQILIADGLVRATTTNDIDLGTEAQTFKNVYLTGTLDFNTGIINSTAALTFQIGAVDILQLDDAAISAFAAAADTAGQDIYIETEDGGADTAVDGGVAGGLFSLKTGDGGAGGAAQAGGTGGAMSMTTGAGAAPASGSANGGDGGPMTMTSGPRGAAGAAGGTGGNGGPILLVAGAAGGAGGGTAGQAGVVYATASMISDYRTVTDDTTAGAATISAAEVKTGVYTRDPNGAGRTDTTDTAANLVAAFPDAVVGSCVVLYVINTADGAEAITIAGGTGVTISNAGQTIGQNEAAILVFRFTNVTASSEAVTVYILGA